MRASLVCLYLTAAMALGGCCVCRPACYDACEGGACYPSGDQAAPCYGEGSFTDGCRPCVARDGTRTLRARAHAVRAFLKSHAPGAHPAAGPAPTPMFHPLPTRPVFAAGVPMLAEDFPQPIIAR